MVLHQPFLRISFFTFILEYLRYINANLGHSTLIYLALVNVAGLINVGFLALFYTHMKIIHTKHMYYIVLHVYDLAKTSFK